MNFDHFISLALLAEVGIGLFGAGMLVGSHFTRKQERARRVRRLEESEADMAEVRRRAHSAAVREFPELASK